tara:strand:+ start:17645 stop:19468 length:1824 start_codon:yes stop_codon:yes gene_type:complete
MAKKYYDYLKPIAPQQTFSDTVAQQLSILEAQQQKMASSRLKQQKEDMKAMAAQEKQLLGFDTEGFSDVHKEAFNNKLLSIRGKVNDYHYSGVNQGAFFEDVMGLKDLHSTFKKHSTNVKSERQALEGWVTGTKDWNDKNNELKDDMNTLDLKNQMWNMSGVESGSINYDSVTGDAYGFYTDINGNRLKDESGSDRYGLVSQAPSLGSKSYYSPTSSPYANLLPGAFAEDFSKMSNMLKSNPNMTYDQKLEEMRKHVTTSAMQNPAVGATAMTQFVENYGEKAFQAVLDNDAKQFEGDSNYIPIDMREYIDETMKFLQGNIADSDDSDAPSVFPSTVEFNLQDFSSNTATSEVLTAEGLLGGSAMQFNDNFGSGISALMVPKSGVGKSSIMVESTYKPQSQDDARYGEVSDQYRVNGVAIDEDRNLFVRAEMYVSQDVSDLSAERLERLRSLQGVDIDLETKTARSKVVRNIVVTPINRDGSRNEEYISILGQIGYAAGVKQGSQQDALKAGMQTLVDFNDSQAQIRASGGAIEDPQPTNNSVNNEDMMDDLSLLKKLEAVEKEEGDSFDVLEYVKANPDRRAEVIANLDQGRSPYLGGDGQLYFDA